MRANILHASAGTLWTDVDKATLGELGGAAVVNKGPQWSFGNLNFSRIPLRSCKSDSYCLLRARSDARAGANHRRHAMGICRGLPLCAHPHLWPTTQQGG
jgi:hypothetical protein